MLHVSTRIFVVVPVDRPESVAADFIAPAALVVRNKNSRNFEHTPSKPQADQSRLRRFSADQSGRRLLYESQN